MLESYIGIDQAAGIYSIRCIESHCRSIVTHVPP
jgi:hypothetical protein